MHEQFEKRLKEFIRKIIKNELKELTTTGDVDGYSTPFAFDDTDEPGSRKKKKEARKNIKEELDEKDMKKIKLIVRRIVSNVLRDIWLKRSAWV
tara:strand:+ start:342 stop:623 length:282 start_codon:yes stop_codon:yes gene_type:complete